MRKGLVLGFVFFFITVFCFSSYAQYQYGESKTIHSHKTARQTAFPTTATTNSVNCTSYDSLLVKASCSSVTSAITTTKPNTTWYVQVGYYDSDMSAYVNYGKTYYATEALAYSSVACVNGTIYTSFPTYNNSNIHVMAWKNSTLGTSAITVIAIPYNHLIENKAYLR